MSVVDTTIVTAAQFIEEKEDEEDSLTQYYFGKPNRSYIRGILKSKENILKSKFHRSLKKKLKKYKLKKNGCEDPEVLDVSQAFKKTLKLGLLKYDKAIKIDDDIERQENYLIKMVRRKQALLNLNKGEIVETSLKNNSLIRKDHHLEETKSNADNVAKKQTNAFKLLMDSRNKRIGGNSPGKDKNLIEPEREEIVEKNKLKVKRNLALQKMADAKGAVKKKEFEEMQEACIKDKMEKRAERLKKMLNKGNTKQKNKVNKKYVSDSEVKKHSNSATESDKLNNDNKKHLSPDEKSRTQKSLLMQKDNSLIIPKKRVVLKEDLEFLNKLSPSIKKKENMLCYFQKVEKEPDGNSYVNEDVNEVGELRIKVKIRQKKRTKNRKLSLRKVTEVDVDCNENKTVEIRNSTPDIEESALINIDNKNRKRKRINLSEPSTENVTENNKRRNSPESEQTPEGRPKRNIKKPIKYNNDVHCLSSSDEELHVFTPKKKKHIANNNTPKDKPKRPSLSKVNIAMESQMDVHNISNEIAEGVKPSKDRNSSKLAPIFRKTQINPAALEAKQKFLQSGMPDQLRKVIAQQKVQDTEAEYFYPVVHVRQMEPIPKVSLINIDLSDDSEIYGDIEDLVSHKENEIKKLLDINETKVEIATPFTHIDVQSTLKYIKEIYPQFPVYRTYKTLSNKKKGDHKDLNCTDMNSSSEVFNGALETKEEKPGCTTWCTKYRATSTKQILGNFDSIQELRKWLITWTSNDTCARSSNDNSDSDFDAYDTDSRDSMRISNNLLALTGPVGSGKTSSVYAVATELAIKVIEVNVSSKRTGKILLQDLQEATQSHKVNRAKGISVESSQNSQEIFGSKSSQSSKKLLKNSKGSSGGVIPLQKSDSLSQIQEDGRTGMSLILIDDADVVFDQDDGFVSAIAQLIQSSKRPVILVVTSVNCQHLQKFLLSGTILKMNSLSPRILGTWLDIMCLVDTKLCWPGIGEKFLEYFHGDIRKAINSLHFLIASETQKRAEDNVLSIPEEQKVVSDIEDEGSNFSWVDRDEAEDKEQTNIVSSQTRADHLLRTSLNYPIDRFHVWWSVPNILKSKDNVDVTSTGAKQDRHNELKCFSDVIDSISLADCFSYKVKPDSKLNISSNPWLIEETDSVSEKENFDYVNNNFEVINDLSNDLVACSLNKARRVFMTEDAEVQFPGLGEQRRRDKIVVRHDALTNAVNPSFVLDRKALALDYWSTCRGICRTEKAKTGNNSKRHKRFTHYLKSSMVINKSIFDKLCDSLSPVDEGQ